MDTDFSSSVQHVVANRLAAKNALRFTGGDGGLDLLVPHGGRY